MTRQTMAVAGLALLGFLIGATAAVSSLLAALVVAVLGVSGWVMALRGTHPLGRDKPDLAWLLDPDAPSRPPTAGVTRPGAPNPPAG